MNNPDPPAVLIGLGACSHERGDHGHEELSKSFHEASESLWTQHHDPLIRDHIERVTARGGALLAGIQVELGSWLAKGSPLHKAGYRDETAVDEAEQRLKGKAPEEYSPEDWLAYIDVLLSRYLPDDVIRREAEYLAVRSVLAGLLQTAESRVKTGEVALIAGMLPETYERAAGLGMIPGQVTDAVLRFAQANAAEMLSGITNTLKHGVKAAVIDHAKRRALGDGKATVASLQSDLLDTFGSANRDWRRVAITECSRNANEGFISVLAPGTKVKRVEVYGTACGFCRSINGRVFTVVGPEAEHDGETQVWVGKTNQGRSSSPRKQSPIGLIERLPEELWWVTAGPIHPNCRGTWTALPGEPGPRVSRGFSDWLERELSRV